MTHMSQDALVLVEEVRKRWVKLKVEEASREALIRQAIAAEFAVRLHQTKLEVAHAMRLAIDSGSTKVALRNVTSKNPGTVEKFLALVESHDLGLDSSVAAR